MKPSLIDHEYLRYLRATTGHILKCWFSHQFKSPRMPIFPVHVSTSSSSCRDVSRYLVRFSPCKIISGQFPHGCMGPTGLQCRVPRAVLACIKSLTILFNVALPQTHAVVSDRRLTAIELQLAGISLLWASSFGGMASPKISTGSNFVELGCWCVAKMHQRCTDDVPCHAENNSIVIALYGMTCWSTHISCGIFVVHVHVPSHVLSSVAVVGAIRYQSAERYMLIMPFAGELIVSVTYTKNGQLLC